EDQQIGMVELLAARPFPGGGDRDSFELPEQLQPIRLPSRIIVLAGTVIFHARHENDFLELAHDFWVWGGAFGECRFDFSAGAQRRAWLRFSGAKRKRHAAKQESER